MTHESPNTDPWRYRRRFLMIYTAFVIIIVSASVFSPSDVEVAKVTISAGLMSLAGVVGTYVFGAAWERKEMEAPKTRPYGNDDGWSSEGN